MRGKKLKLILSLTLAAILVISVITGCSIGRAAEAIAFENEAGYFEGGDVMKEMPAEAVEAEMYAEEAGAPMGDEAAVSSELYTQAGSTDAAVSPTIDTKLIKNASIAIEVSKGEFEKKFFEVVSIAEQNNGYVSNSQSYSDPDGNMTSGVVTIRVDKDRFDIVLSKIKQMGEVDSISIYVQDVTQEYVDNESRLRNLEAQQKRLLELMEMSTSVKDSIEVQRELSNVEGQMEVIKGRQNYLDNLVAYSTIDVYIQEPQPITEPGDGGFLGAIKRGARGALTALRVITMGLIAISPLLVLAGIVVIIVWQSIRARNRRRAARQKKTMDEQKK